MAEKEILTRIQHKYDTQTNWNKATGFTPKKGELIIYSDIKKFKVGDGNSKLSALQFYDIDLSSYATKAYADQAEVDALAAAKTYANSLATNYATAAQGLKADTALQSSDIAAAAKKNVDSSISAGSTSANLPTSAAVASFVEGKGYTKNTGTVTSVAAGGGLAGGTITGSGTISHGDTSSQASITASGRKYITGVTLDGYGHVTGLTTGTETVTNTDTTYDLAASKNSTNGNVQVNLTAGGSGSGTDSVTIKGSGATTVTTDANGVITISSTDNNTTYTFNGAVSTIKDSNLTASRALISNSSGKVAVSDITSTELGYLDGVTSNIQTQLNDKVSKSSTSVQTINGGLNIGGTPTAGTGVGRIMITGQSNPLIGLQATDANGNKLSPYYFQVDNDIMYLGPTSSKALSFDRNGNVSIPATLSVTGSISEGGTALSSKYAASSHTHNYAGSSSAGGAATSANKVNSSLTVKLNGGTTEGTNMFTFNGSAAKAVNITPANIGAAAASDLTALKNLVGTTAVSTQISNAIATIPTPDVSGQIATHNSSTSAHSDIRNSVSSLNTRLTALESSVVTIHSGAEEPISTLGEDGDLYLVTE